MLMSCTPVHAGSSTAIAKLSKIPSQLDVWLDDPDGHFKIPHLWPGQNTPPWATVGDNLLAIRSEIQVYSFFILKLFVCFRSGGWTLL